METEPTATAPFPDPTEQALLAFLLEICDPRLAIRDRPDRTAPRKTRRHSDYPRRKTDDPPTRPVTHRLELHCLDFR